MIASDLPTGHTPDISPVFEVRPSPTPVDSPESPVERICRVLGDKAVLIPVQLGQKGPKTPGWQKIVLADTQAPGYAERLLRGNIGILLGEPSSGLCAIDIDVDEAVEPFLDLNPLLKTTLRTKGSRGCQIWIRITDEQIPAAAKLKTEGGSDWGEWRATSNQSIIHGRHPNGNDYQWLVAVPVIEIAFDAIIWPDDLVLPWGDQAYRELVQKVGEPVDGKSFNPSFFSGSYLQKNPVAIRDGEICIYDCGTGTWSVPSENTTNRSLMSFSRRLLDELKLEHMKGRLKKGFIDEMTWGVKTDGPRFPAKKEGHFIHVKNGMLELKAEGCELHPFSPDYESFHQVEIEYQPEATCPRFTAWLEGSLEAEDITLFQEWCGAVLLGPNLAQRILLLHGTGGSGKSSFVSIVEEIIGKGACHQLRISQLGGRFEMREYRDKILLTGIDVKSDFLCDKNTGFLKSLTGGDRLSAERKGENESISFQAKLHVGITSNNELALRIDGDADAWERRLLSIRTTKPENRRTIPDMEKFILREEGPGVLAWMVEGARRHLANNFAYTLTETQKATIQRIVNAADGVRLFVDQKLVAEGDNAVTMSELSNAYDQFAKAHGYQRPTDQEFSRRIIPLIHSQLGLNQRHDLPSGFLNQGGTVRGYKGLVILP